MSIINIADLKIGAKVHYIPDHYKGAGENEQDKWENGMVKEIPDHTNTAIRVVYNCGGEWDRFKDFTSALTNLTDLKMGWRHDAESETWIDIDDELNTST